MTEPRRSVDPHASDDWTAAGPEMDPAMDDALRALSASVEFPPTPDLAARVRARVTTEVGAHPADAPVAGEPLPVPLPAPAPLPSRLGAHPASRFRLRRATVLAFAALLVLAGVVAAFVFDIGGIRIVFVPVVPTPQPTVVPSAMPSASSAGPSGSASATATAAAVGADLGLGRLVTLDAAAADLGFTPLAPPSMPILGEPDAVYVDAVPEGGMLAYVYAPRTGFPETTPGGGVGLIVTEFRADLRAEYFQKVIGPGTTLTEAVVHDAPAYFLSGELHAFLYRRANGEVDDERFRLVGNALLWQRGDLTLRLEGDLTLDQALAVARSMP